MMIRYIQCDSTHQGFITLTKRLDDDLFARNGQEQQSYQQYNVITNLPTVIVAMEDSTPVACGCFKVLEEDTVEIKRVFVLPEHRGKGIAKTLLQQLEAWAFQLGYRYAVLETGLAQAEAVRLYERRGYQRIPNYGQYAGMPNSLCYRKTLTVEAES